MSVSGPTPNWDVVEVRIHKVTSTGVPLNGQIIFSPRVVAAKDLGALTDVLMRPFRAVVVDGVGSVFLPASDDPSISPLPIEYDVDEVFAGGHLPRFVLSVPLSAKASGIDYAAVSPAGVVPPSTPAFVGPAGPTGPAGAPGAAGAAGPAGATGATGPAGAGAAIRGTGFPANDGTLYPIGTHYIDTAVTNGAVEWIKVANTGSYQWRVLSGDTGRRSVNFSDGTLLLQRTAAGLFFTVAADAGSNYLYPGLFPPGFRPQAGSAGLFLNGDEGRILGWTVSGAGDLYEPTATGFGLAIFDGNLLPAPGWPTGNLPGVDVPL